MLPTAKVNAWNNMFSKGIILDIISLVNAKLKQVWQDIKVKFVGNAASIFNIGAINQTYKMPSVDG